MQYNGSSRFTTTSWGAQVAGGTFQFLNTNIENLRGVANDTNSILLKNNTGTALEINHASSNSYIKNSVGDLIIENQSTERLRVDTAGIDVTGNIVVSGTVDGRDVATDGTKLDVVAAGIPQNSQTNAYTLVAGDNNKHVNTTTGGVTIPSGVFSAGNVVSIYNDSSSNQTITQASGVTLRLAGGSSTGNRTLAQYGLCSVLCVGSDEFVISGAGLT